MTPRRLLLVAAGGTIGTAARLLLALWMPESGRIPFATLAVNVLGALLIGVLAARPLGGSGGRMTGGDVRVFLSTGILGGFTTYSAFAIGTVELWAAAPVLAVAYAAATLVLGVAACALGMRLGRPKHLTGEAR